MKNHINICKDIYFARCTEDNRFLPKIKDLAKYPNRQVAIYNKRLLRDRGDKYQVILMAQLNSKLVYSRIFLRHRRDKYQVILVVQLYSKLVYTEIFLLNGRDKYRVILMIKLCRKLPSAY